MDITKSLSVTYLAIAVSAALGLLTLVLYTRLFRPNELRTVVTGSEKCRMLIVGNGLAVSTVGNKLDPLESRALPNQRLVQVFGIDNAFTTSDKKRLEEFTRQAKAVIDLSNAAWDAIGRKARMLVEQSIGDRSSSSNNTSGALELEGLVQGLTLKIVLDVLFKVDALQLDNDSISTAAKEINRLWVLSKTPRTLVQRIQGLWSDEQHDLRQALRMLIPDQGSSSHENPMNLILPAYETLWRIVLLGFVEVNFPYQRSSAASQGHEWREAVKLFSNLPSKDLDLAPIANGISAWHVVSEILRLYPSVKRISRRIHLENKWFPEECAADVEATQRDQEVWGADADEFNPSRWMPEKFGDGKEKKESAYMPFGYARFRCPARFKFGPKIIALLVGALCRGIPNDWELYHATDHDVFQKRGALPSGRDSFRDWFVGRAQSDSSG